MIAPMRAPSSAQPPPLENGQRAPDFLLPTPSGKFGRLYDRFLGNPVVLLFLPSKEADRARALPDPLLGVAADLRETGAHLVIVTRDDPIHHPDVAAHHGRGLSVFTDPAGAITRGYAADRTDGPTVYILDRNQRVVGRLDDAHDMVGRIRNGLAAATLPALPVRTVGHQAPVLLLPEVVDASLRRRAIAAWRADHAEGAVRQRARTATEAADDSATRTVNYDLKKRLDHRPDDALNRALTETAIGRLGPELYKAFHFRAVAAERFCIGAYEAGRGDYFRPHRDNSTAQTERRRFAITLNLNDDYEGGGVRFPEYSDDVYAPPAGGALVFSCSLLHEALPVTNGTRFAALSFLFGVGDVPPRGTPG